MLDKKALRQFAGNNPAPAIPSDHGLLYAPQVDYVIRTDTRIIGHRRTLVLYVYDRQEAAAGASAPVWTMFQAGGDYVTLARSEDGSTRWREAAFENLGGCRFTGKCAFYSAQDEQRICEYFHDADHGGIAALVRAQQAILDERAAERQRRRERRTIDRMRPIRALPRELPSWIRREAMPAYFRCDHILAHVTPHRFMKYMDGVKGRYGNMQHAVSEYRDYLDMCAKLEYDMSNGFVLYPRDLREAHDEVARHVKAKADARMRREFQAAMQAISGRLDFEAEGMKIVLPDGPDDIVAEGQALHHCVGGYVDHVARHECVILFLRKCEEIAKPFYTVEIRGWEIVQVRGMDNCDPTPEVEDFMDKWERQVLQAA